MMALPQGLLLVTVVPLALGRGLVFGVASRWFLPRFDVAVDAQALAMLTVLMMAGYVLAAVGVLNLAMLTVVLWAIRWFFYRRELQASHTADSRLMPACRRVGLGPSRASMARTLASVFCQPPTGRV